MPDGQFVVGQTFNFSPTLRPLGNVVYVLPPYIISPDQLHRVYDVITEAIQTLL